MNKVGMVAAMMAVALVGSLGLAQANAVAPEARKDPPPLHTQIGLALRAANYDLHNDVKCVRIQVEGQELNYQRC